MAVGRLRTALFAGLVAAAVPALLPSAPAGAHAGGRAQLYVESVHLEPQPTGWRAELVVRDADSGKPEPGVGVALTATGDGRPAVGPVALTDPDGDGRYTALVPLTEGLWTVALEADEIPGGPRALPFARTWPATLQAGRPVDLGGSGSRPAEPGGGGHVPARPLALALLAGVVGLLGLRRIRPRSWTGVT